MKSLSLVLIWMSLAVTCVLAQTEVQKSEKTVNVSVEKNDEGQRSVSVTITHDGEVKEINWQDDGAIPEDVRKMLEEEDIDISMLEKDGEEVEVRVRKRERRNGSKDGTKKRIIVKKDDGGETEVLKWDGEGEMPEDIKMLLEEHDIDLKGLTEEALQENRKKKHGEMRKRHRMRKHKAISDGKEMNEEKEIEYEIIREDGDVLKWKSKGGDKGSNAYMGAQIASSEEGGVVVLELLKDSPADQSGLAKGDIIRKINGARTKNVDSLHSLLSHFEPGDVIDLSIVRDGAERNLKLTLGERPGDFR